MEQVELVRDCEAVQIPSGHSVTLEKGTEVTITQSLGGSYTVQAPSYGGLFRIAGQDADALGKEVAAGPAEAAAAYARARELTANAAEQAFLDRRIAEVAGSGGEAER